MLLLRPIKYSLNSMSRRAISYLHAETDALIETQSLDVFLVSTTSISHNIGNIESRACMSYRALLFPAPASIPLVSLPYLNFPAVA